MEIFTPKSYSQAKSVEPMLTVGLKGLLTFNRAMIEKLALKPGHGISFGKRTIKDARLQDEVQYCIFIDGEGFALRSTSGKSLQFNAKQFVEQLIKDLDLALSPEKKSSVRFSIEKDTWEGKEVWKLV